MVISDGVKSVDVSYNGFVWVLKNKLTGEEIDRCSSKHLAEQSAMRFIGEPQGTVTVFDPRWRNDEPRE